MKRQDQSSSKPRFSASVLRDLQVAYRTLDRATGRQPWLVQGSVNVVAPKSPAAKVTYTWTRKVRAKTITVALSHKQAVVFRRAISSNRQIEEALSRLRQVSQAALLAEVPGVTQRRSDGQKNTEAKSVLKVS
jgi:hypothetical protein